MVLQARSAAVRRLDYRYGRGHGHLPPGGDGPSGSGQDPRSQKVPISVRGGKAMRARLAWALSLAGALALGGVTYAQAPAMTVISDIRQESAGDSTRLVVVSNGPLTYTYYSPDPLTLIVDVPDVDVTKVPAKLNVGTAEVESLRVTPMTRGEGRSLA